MRLLNISTRIGLIIIGLTLVLIPIWPHLYQEMPAISPPHFSAEAGDFDAYWYQGKAEISSYELEELRYGTIRKGHAVLVFVTEDFSKSKQVKLDYPERNVEDRAKVMKLNYVKKFTTGIYPYSLLQSVFTPIDQESYQSSLKLSNSIQEWCGHTFQQINQKEENYQVRSFSYFEAEGDQEFTLEKAFLEDDLFNQIRINPAHLPEGEINIIPSSLQSQMRHWPLKVQQAKAKRQIKKEVVVYQLSYPQLGRTLQIRYENKFPYKILGWEESLGGKKGQVISRARLKKSLLLDYWNLNKLEDEVWRDKLGIIN